MKKPSQNLQTRSSRRHEREVEVGATGALAGAAIGAIAGPPGALAGAILGGVVGALAGATLDDQSVDSATHEGALDTAIGVSGGDLGAPGLEHPPAVVGIYSAATSGGAASAVEPPADGPMQVPGL